MTKAASLTLIAHHEIRLAWRDFFAMLTAGRPGRARNVAIALVVFVALMHLPAYAVVGRFSDISSSSDKPTLIVITATLVFAWALMLSQAMESVTRVFYARSDLDLIMSSPFSLTSVFSIRMAAIAISVTMMTLLFSMPFINVLAIGGGLRWLSAYGVVIAIGVTASAIAMSLTTALFCMIGPRRTRLVAQIVAAVIGAGFVIALQVVAIVSYGTLSRFAVLTSDAVTSLAPGAESVLWWPVRAILGDGAAMVAFLAASFVLLGITIAILAPRLGSDVISASATAATTEQGSRNARPFRSASRRQALRWKEFKLLRRDPWLVSQTLMQLLYLLPPALMLWRCLADTSTAIVLLPPVVVMAAGQLAGGLAWLAISGEDAPDLVATSPLMPFEVTRAKVETVLIIVSIVFLPLVVPLIVFEPVLGIFTVIGIVVSASSATAIQLWFKVQARRSQFRRRQTSSRLATITEALSSIGWAATAGLALSWPITAVLTALMTSGLLVVIWKFSPRPASRQV